MAVTDLKLSLYKSCLAFIDARIENARQALKDAQEASNNESKSTAGDKHDTTRAMMQIEAEQASKQIKEAEKLRDELKRIIPTKTYDTVVAGSLVITTSGNYFVTIAAGKITVENQTYFAVSVSSPIMQALKGLKAGDTAVLNGNKIQITAVS